MASTGLKPVTYAIAVRCSTNWAMKPNIESQVNQFSSYLPVRSEMMWRVILYESGCIWKWRMIIAVKFPNFPFHGKIWTQMIDLAADEWFHSSVGRASHRYRGGHGFESGWSPDFFTAMIILHFHRQHQSVQIWIISYNIWFTSERFLIT